MADRYVSIGPLVESVIYDDVEFPYAIQTDGVISCATVIITPQLHEPNTKNTYVAGELDSEAKIIVAINATNTTINSIITKLEALGFFATS